MKNESLYVTNDNGLWIVSAPNGQWWTVSPDLTHVVGSSGRTLKHGSSRYEKCVAAVLAHNAQETQP